MSPPRILLERHGIPLHQLAQLKGDLPPEYQAIAGDLRQLRREGLVELRATSQQVEATRQTVLIGETPQLAVDEAAAARVAAAMRERLRQAKARYPGWGLQLVLNLKQEQEEVFGLPGGGCGRRG